MKKVLVFLDENKLKPCGGPYGYNYNLKSGIDIMENKVKDNIKIDYINTKFKKIGFKNKLINIF